jgi:hypothetical protein
MLTQLFCNAPNEVILEGVRVERTQTAVETLTATWSLLDADGVELGTGSLAKIEDTDADYLAFIPLSVAEKMTAGGEYALIITDNANLGIRCEVLAINYGGRSS